METPTYPLRPMSESLRAALDALRLDQEGGAGSAARAALEAAEIVRGLDGEDALVIATALQGNTRSQPSQRDALIAQFGLAAADLTRDLQSLGQFRLPHDWTAESALTRGQTEGLRKMLIAMVADVRLVLVRLAEQLQRLRSMRSLPLDAQRRLAIETQEIHAPLANRLGVWQLKWELEDLAFRALEPAHYSRIAQVLSSSRTEREEYLREFRAQLHEELARAGIAAQVSARPKHIYSIYRKMQRKGLAFERLMDVRAARVLVDSVADCYAALGIVHARWPFIATEFDDYIATPKDNHYQSLHTAVLGPAGLAVEVQIRTQAMHLQAEGGVSSHWRYKEGGRSDRAYERKINELRALLSPPDGAEPARGLLEKVRAGLFHDRVHALTPRGDILDVPRGGTPLDFAYRVHTDVGHRTRGAKVNGRMVPLNHRLRNGDVVQILTAKEARPSRDWLAPRAQFVASAQHRAKIKAWFRQHDARVENALPAARTAPQPPSHSSKRISRSTDAAPNPSLPSKAAAETAPRVGDWLSSYAKCCSPLPPEPIGGYIAVGRGVSIHARACRNFLRLSQLHPARVLPIEWPQHANAQFAVHLEILALDRHGLVRDIGAAIAEENIGINGMQTTSRKDHTAEMSLTLVLSDLSQLSKVLMRIEKMPHVLSARRVQARRPARPAHSG